MTADCIQKIIRVWKTKSAGSRLAAVCLSIALAVAGIAVGIVATVQETSQPESMMKTAVQQGGSRPRANRLMWIPKLIRCSLSMRK